MKLIIIKTNLKDGLETICGASGENLNLPILKQGLLTISDGLVKLTATNLEIAVSCVVSGKIIEGGLATFPINTLLNLINNIPSERLNIENNKNILEIKTDNYNATIQGLSPDDFPIIPKISPTTPSNLIEIESAVLKDALNQVIISTQHSDLRPELSSVLFSFTANGLKIVGTDSFRLSEKTIPPAQFKANNIDAFRILVPLKTVSELLKILKPQEATQLYHDQNQVLFKTARYEFISRLVEGIFPDYTTIIPQKFDAEITVNREEFVQALKLTGIFGSRFNEVKVRIAANKKNLEIFSADQALGENHYFLPAKIQGKVGEVSFNWKHLLDGLRVLKTEEVYFGANSEENKPALLKSPNDATYFYILMPILKT